MIRLITIFCVISSLALTLGCEREESDSEPKSTQASETTIVDFWSGNRSQARQIYERQVLEAILDATKTDYGPWKISETMEEYPGQKESLVFTEQDHDLFVTIAGNKKFEQDDMIVVPHPIAKNLLGYRIAIIREADAEKFNAVDQLKDIQKLTHGIPETWSDATIFRHNGFQVSEQGDFGNIFDRLAEGRFDYSAYGANEVLGIYDNRASKREGLVIEDNLVFFYPFPLVFYINPEQVEVAERVESGLQAIIDSGKLDRIYNQHYGNIVNELELNKRQLFILENPLIPEAFRDLSPGLEKL